MREGPRWRYQASVRPWTLALYPFSTVHARTTCLPWIRPIGATFPPWFPQDAAPYVATKPVLLEARDETASKQAAGVTRLLTGSGSTIASVKAITKREGALGLYRGFVVNVIHAGLRDATLFTALHVAYPPLRDWFHWTAITTYELCKIVLGPPIEETAAPAPPAPAAEEDASGPPYGLATGSSSPAIDLAHACVKAGVETLFYPLIVIKNRLIVHEGPELLGLFDMVELSYRFDGLRDGFFGGFGTYMGVRALEDLADVTCLWACRQRDLAWNQTLTIRAGIAAMVSAAVAPLSSLALVQSVQSSVPGLCDRKAGCRDILEQMPWKGFLLNCALTTGMAAFSIAISLAMPSSLENQEGEGSFAPCGTILRRRRTTRQSSKRENLMPFFEKEPTL